MHEPLPTWGDFVAGWELGIYRDPVLVGLLAGLVLGYLGVFVVLRRMVFVTAAISQASGLGVATAFWAAIHLGIAVPPVAGAAIAALLLTALVATPPVRSRSTREGVLGVAYLACSAGAIVLGEHISQEAHDISAILFGTAVLVRPEDLWLVAGVGGVVLLLHVLWHRGLTFATFDPESARVQGVPVRLLDVASWATTALAVSVATRALGVLPVFAFAVLPALAALQLFERLRYVLGGAAALGATAGGTGYVAAFFLSLPVGAAQTLVAFVLYLGCVSARLAARRPRPRAAPAPPML